VLDVQKIGYQLRGRTIRPALVGVSKKWWIMVARILFWFNLKAILTCVKLSQRQASYVHSLNIWENKDFCYTMHELEIISVTNATSLKSHDYFYPRPVLNRFQDCHRVEVQKHLKINF
jgi:hypothetical protein